MDRLRPCPFCGGEAYIDSKTLAPTCTKCQATIPSAASVKGIFRKYFDKSGYREYMISLWNRRTKNE